MALNYEKLNDEDKYILESELKDKIIDIDKTVLISIVLVFLSPLINIIPTYVLLKIIAYVAYCILFSRYIVVSVKKYRVYKFYLQVINDVNTGTITFVNENKKDIKFNTKKKNENIK
ncbi:hypothetical protein IAI10_20300 [Clostridium sp. 19966]|uniref:hypothetical protein n=1 Tax=Clostridium sp. 19966 TaxID=2768166 RepID=UPI0028E018EB|nr:hypothetical protein [Clostridium sp. 19966]MDT8718999.1 hypothetical protein [Clostridium sp. 19966]